MKKKIMALVLAASMITVPFATAYASEKDAAAEKTEESADETKETTESPVAGKKIAYIMYMTPATIFQMWSDSFIETAEKLGIRLIRFSAMTVLTHGNRLLNSVHRADMMD